ncbi:MAG: methionine synthase, partial [Xanthobacteraceae bacterium]|nr:methionine synthase [Xanthobacteraceae bacterium]
KTVEIGAIDVATDVVETADQVADVVGEVLKYVAPNKIVVSTNCGMAPMHADIAWRKLGALEEGAALARQRYG